MEQKRDISKLSLPLFLAVIVTPIFLCFLYAAYLSGYSTIYHTPLFAWIADPFWNFFLLWLIFFVEHPIAFLFTGASFLLCFLFLFDILSDGVLLSPSLTLVKNRLFHLKVISGLSIIIIVSIVLASIIGLHNAAQEKQHRDKILSAFPKPCIDDQYLSKISYSEENNKYFRVYGYVLRTTKHSIYLYAKLAQQNKDPKVMVIQNQQLELISTPICSNINL